jgi:hypothetical protein
MVWCGSARTALFGVASNMEDRGSKRKAFHEQVFGGLGAIGRNAAAFGCNFLDACS